MKRGVVMDVSPGLFNFSYDLASSSRENSEAANQVNNTMSIIHDETQKQIESLTQTEGLLNTLEEHISDAIKKSNVFGYFFGIHHVQMFGPRV